MPEVMERRLLGPTGEAAAWPPAVRDELARRRATVLAAAERAGGRVLDLADHAALIRALDEGDRGPGGDLDRGRGYDVVVSIAALVAAADLPALLRGVERLLDPDGKFLFVEPASRPGWSGVIVASAGAGLKPVRYQHLGRDVPLAVRQAGFIITDLERFTMSTSLWPLRSFVHGCGRPRSGFAATPLPPLPRSGAAQQEGTR
jgi:hypothetical protein